MIRQDNLQQILQGVLQVLSGLALVGVMWVAFVYLAGLLMFLIPWTWSKDFTAKQVASYATVGVNLLAVRWWFRQGERFQVLKDAAFHAAMQENPDGDTMKEGEDYISDATDIIALALYSGPRLICTGITRVVSRLSNDPDLEARMVDVLQRIRERKGWIPAEQARDHVEAVGALIRCGLVDYSSSKHRLCAALEADGSKALPPEEEEDR